MSRCLLFLAAFLSFHSLAGASTWHVDSTATPGGDGTTWGTAFHDLREALAVAARGDEVWLKQGTYPTSPGFYHGMTTPYPNG